MMILILMMMIIIITTTTTIITGYTLHRHVFCIFLSILKLPQNYMYRGFKNNVQRFNAVLIQETFDLSDDQPDL